MYTLTIEDTPRSEDVQRLAQGLTAHALPYTQVPGFAPLGVFLKDEYGALVGGVYRNPRTGGIRSTSSMTQLQPSQDHGAPLLHDLTIVPFRPEHQANVKRLILAGLTEHWGQLDPTKNPDLNDIAATYAHATFLVAWWHGTIVGTGALLPQSAHSAEIVRISVAAHMRRHGIGRCLLQHLVAHAQARGYRHLILETTATWHGVIAFYQQYGFQITHDRDGNVYFMLDLTSLAGQHSDPGNRHDDATNGIGERRSGPL